MKLSVLDHSMVSEGQPPAATIQDSLALARHCDTLGYHRYWVSEHHSSRAIAGTAPEILIAAIAATTRHMRIGSGGVMLPHYAALKIAEQFRVLEAIAPGRIDLGIGRAPGSDQLTARALNPHANASGQDEFPAQLNDLLSWLRNTPLPAAHPFRRVTAEPSGTEGPQVWMLGSSDYGAQIAAYFGLPYCYAHFFMPGRAADARAAQALSLYRDNFRPSAHLAAPYAALAVTALAADTQDQAAYQLGSRLLSSLRRESGIYSPLPTPEEAATHPYTDAEQAWLARARAAEIHGTPHHVATALRSLATTLAADELFIVSNAHNAATRRHSFTLIAQAVLQHSQAA
jgi:luciferase family oxidoreductase group 1